MDRQDIRRESDSRGSGGLADVLTPPAPKKHPEAVAALGNITALLDQVRRGTKLDAATLGSLHSMAGQVLDAINADGGLPAGSLVKASDLIAIIADMMKPHQEPDDSDPYGGIDTGHQGPEGNTVSFALSGEVVGKSMTLGGDCRARARPAHGEPLGCAGASERC